jgi:Anaerobic dehydrogenases, typically selenocysteine-containing
MDIGVKNGRIVGIRGREVDRINHGRLGPKGLHGWVANNSKDRLKYPLIREGGKKEGKFRQASWNEAMELIVKKSKEIIGKYTSDAIAFYSTGQLFIEEYYTLAVIAKAGIGTSLTDGNTRLCTATAAAALRQTFGSDGQPGSYTDYDTTDCIFLVGHNMSSTQTVQWMRILDRLKGPNPPKAVVLDPRLTATSREATVHLAPRIGTAIAVLNGIQNLLIENGWIDNDFINKHTIGFEKLKKIVSEYTPDKVEEISGVKPETLYKAAEIIGTTPTLVSSALQGVYQSEQATATACQINNINLLRGMIGRPGCSILQFNGQPTAQNNRETGCNGEQPGFRNVQNPKHMEDLSRIWNVDVGKIPLGETAHIMEIMDHAEAGSVKMLWVICTNPAVSLPDLARVRRILSKPDMFLVVQDCFPTETTEFADVILPAGIWGEKTGTFTNTDRTVHISYKAVDPPGDARSDFDIFLDYARRMDFRDKDGAPLIKWNDPEGAFEGWKECSKDCLCDYSGLTYAKLTGGSGIQWPCNEQNPDGTERLYTDFVFRTDEDVCETHGNDLETGGNISPEEYKAWNPAGKALLKGARYMPPFEEPDEEYPFRLSTGRIVYHFHTRTKTGRSRELEEAAPHAFAQISEEDAARLSITDGEMVDVRSRRGIVRVPAKIGNIEVGHIFIPFHYGYWDEHECRPRAANELTIPLWDPISKQPHFKMAAAQLTKAVEGPIGTIAEGTGEVTEEAEHQERSHVPDYLGILYACNDEFIKARDMVSQNNATHLDIVSNLRTLKKYSNEAKVLLDPFLDKYGRHIPDEPDRLRKLLFKKRSGEFSLIRDLQDLFLMASDTQIALEIMKPTAAMLRDKQLRDACEQIIEYNKKQMGWITTQLQLKAPHNLVVPT